MQVTWDDGDGWRDMEMIHDSSKLRDTRGYPYYVPVLSLTSKVKRGDRDALGMDATSPYYYRAYLKY